MRRSYGRAWIFLLLLIPLSATVSRPDSMPRGRIELSPSVAFARADLSSREGDAGQIILTQVSIGIGECITNVLEIEGRCNLEVVDIEQEWGYGLVSYAFGASGGLTLNMETAGSLTPYFHLGIGGEISGDVATKAFPIVEAGGRVSIGQGAAIRMGLAYQHKEDALGVDGATADIVLLKVGLTTFLRRE